MRTHIYVISLALSYATAASGCGSNPTGASASGATNGADVSAGTRQFSGDVWADNWFALYQGDRLLVEDSVSIETERSFNAESFTFSGSYPMVLSFVLKDYKANDSGLEYIGKPNQQVGDGGLIAQIRDEQTGKTVLVSSSAWKCKVIHRAPLNEECIDDPNPEGTCKFESEAEPAGWRDPSFDDSAWPSATEHDKNEVRPKDGYDRVSWDPSARFIWGPDLRIDNTVLCRARITAP